MSGEIRRPSAMYPPDCRALGAINLGLFGRGLWASSNSNGHCFGQRADDKFGGRHFGPTPDKNRRAQAAITDL